MSIISDNIRIFRKQKGLTQVELANSLGLKQYNITNYERGTRLPNADKILEIANALGITVADIYGQATKEESKPRKAPNSREKQMQDVFENLSAVEQRLILKQAKGLLKD